MNPPYMAKLYFALRDLEIEVEFMITFISTTTELLLSSQR